MKHVQQDDMDNSLLKYKFSLILIGSNTTTSSDIEVLHKIKLPFLFDTLTEII